LKTRKTGQTGRLRSDSEWIYGLNPVVEAVRAGRAIKGIFLSSGRHERVFEIKKEAASRNIPVNLVAPDFFAAFSKGHQGVAAEVSCREDVPLDDLIDIPFRKTETPLFFILDCIEDPRNFGAILRVADAAGVHGVVVQTHRSARPGPLVSKASAGAVEYVPVCSVSNIKHAVREMKNTGIIIVGTEAGTGTSLWDVNLDKALAILIGSEGKGLRRTVKSLCDIVVSIPVHGKINSLNAAVATGVVVFEILRQRIQNIKK
jgi:23S rRNA (guanosine2251-2'-O)-methyltransferase